MAPAGHHCHTAQVGSPQQTFVHSAAVDAACARARSTRQVAPPPPHVPEPHHRAGRPRTACDSPMHCLSDMSTGNLHRRPRLSTRVTSLPKSLLAPTHVAFGSLHAAGGSAPCNSNFHPTSRRYVVRAHEADTSNSADARRAAKTMIAGGSSNLNEDLPFYPKDAERDTKTTLRGSCGSVDQMACLLRPPDRGVR